MQKEEKREEKGEAMFKLDSFNVLVMPNFGKLFEQIFHDSANIFPFTNSINSSFTFVPPLRRNFTLWVQLSLCAQAREGVNHFGCRGSLN